MQTVFDFTSELTDSYNKKNDTLAIYRDFKKVFDTVNHTILIKKLSNFNFGNNFKTLIESSNPINFY